MLDNKLRELVTDNVDNFSDPTYNFAMGQEYESLDQKASALSYYLRTAELSYKTMPTLTYCALLKVGLCLERQGGREHSVSNNYLQAIAYQPTRPEAYYLMARFYERAGSWQESYTFAEMGLAHAHNRHEPLASDVDYDGPYRLMFQKAVAAWWLGRKEECFGLFRELITQHKMDGVHVAAVLNNIKNLGI